MYLNSSSSYSLRQTKISNLFRALGHPARVAIIEKIANQNDCIENEVVNIHTIVPSTAKEHLNGLKKAGLINGTFNSKDGFCYCINWQKMDELKKLFDSLYKEVKQNKKNVIEHNAKCTK